MILNLLIFFIKMIFGECEGGRMGWDSNPRDALTPAGFQDRCLKPLGHPSVKWLDYRLLWL